MIGPFKQLSDYVEELRRLLHDPNDQYWPVADKIGYINEGIQRRDLDTGQNRVLFPFTLTVGQDIYAFSDLETQNPQPPKGPTAITAGALSQSITVSPAQTAGYNILATSSWGATVTTSLPVAGSFLATFSSAAPTGALLYWQIYGTNVKPNAARVFDTVALILNYNNVRYVLSQLALSVLNQTVRIYVTPYRWVPLAYARYGPQEIIFGPAPSVAYTMEWDCSTTSPPLAYLPDADLLPYPYTIGAAYYAAYLAKLNERQYDEASGFQDLYLNQIRAAVDARAGQVTAMYSAGIVRV